MYAQSLVETYKESKSVLGAIYLAPFRHPNMYSFTANLSIPAYKGVDDPTSSLRNMVKCGDFCKEMVNAAEVDSNTYVSTAIWEIMKSCTWDPAVLESLGSMRPFASQMKLLVKLMECESCRKLLSPSQPARCRRHARIHSQSAVSVILSRCAAKYPEQSIKRIISIAQTKPPCELTRFVLENYFGFVGVSMVNFALPDPVEVVVRPRDTSHILVGPSMNPQYQLAGMRQIDLQVGPGAVQGFSMTMCTLVGPGRDEM